MSHFSVLVMSWSNLVFAVLASVTKANMHAHTYVNIKCVCVCMTVSVSGLDLYKRGICSTCPQQSLQSKLDRHCSVDYILDNQGLEDRVSKQ